MDNNDFFTGLSEVFRPMTDIGKLITEQTSAMKEMASTMKSLEKTLINLINIMKAFETGELLRYRRSLTPNLSSMLSYNKNNPNFHLNMLSKTGIKVLFSSLMTDIRPLLPGGVNIPGPRRFGSGAGLGSVWDKSLVMGDLVAAGGPILMGFTAALAFATTAALSFAKGMKENSEGMARSGAYLGQARGFHSFAGGLGLSDSELGSRAQSFGQLLSSGGIAAGIAAQIGIKPYSGLGGDQNVYQKFKTAAQDIISGNYSYNERTLRARSFGMEDLVQYSFADKMHQNMLLNSNSGMGMSPQAMMEAANSQIEFNIALREFMDMLKDIGAVVLPFITDAFKHLFAVVIGAIIGFTVGGPLGALAGGLLGKGFGDLFNGNPSTDANTGAINNQTRATMQNTNAVMQNTMMQNGSYGGGSVFQSGNIIPKGWGNMNIMSAANGTSIALGALSL